MLKTLTHSKVALLFMLTIAMAFSHMAWSSLLNNYAVETIHFDGSKMGFLQSIREIPGFLAFTIVIVLGFFSAQRLAYISLMILGVGVILTGQTHSILGLYVATIITSIGFHYIETLNQTMSLQWLPKSTAPIILGKLSATRSITSLVVFTLIYLLMKTLHVSYESAYIFFGVGTILIGLVCWILFEHFSEDIPQKRSLKLKKEYWLFYLLTFLAGARRQIFMVFATFLMVEKFGLKVHEMASLLFINATINMYLAPKIGRFIAHFGERLTLRVEYIGLMIVFVSYAFVENIYFACALYVADHLLFAMAIALKTYFQKIANPQDLASASAISFTINHIAAVFLPALLGLIWLYSNALVFILGASVALLSFSLSFLVPSHPSRGYETALKKKINN